MMDFLHNLSSPSWWVGVVAVGIVINLVSSYLKPRIDNWAAGFSAKRRSRLERQRQEHETHVNLLATDPLEFDFVALSEIRRRQRCVMGLLFSVILFLIVLVDRSNVPITFSTQIAAGLSAEPVVLAFASVTFFMAFLEFRQALRDESLLFEARRLRRAKVVHHND
jgi:hypothetical protein